MLLKKRIGACGRHTRANQRLSVTFLVLALALQIASVHALEEEFDDYEGFDTREEYEAYQQQRIADKNAATELMNKVVMVLSAIICPIMLALVICNCIIKYKRK